MDAEPALASLGCILLMKPGAATKLRSKQWSCGDLAAATNRSLAVKKEEPEDDQIAIADQIKAP